MQTGYYQTGRDPMGKAFAGSLVTHGVVIGLLVTSGLFQLSKNNFGDAKVSSGSVGVSMVKTIPLAQRKAAVNPLANDTTSVVPPTPAPVKLQKQVKAQPEKAIEIPDKVSKKRKVSPLPQMKDLFRPPDAYKSNQAPSNIPQAASTPMYGIQGAGGIDIGPASVLGNRFGAYVDLMRDRISQHWNTASVHSLPSQKCQISFTIARNGTITNVNVTQPSGDYLLDTSAKRAVLDANPLPALPAQFERNEATVELWFQLNK